MEENESEEAGQSEEGEQDRYFDQADVDRGRELVEAIATNQYNLGELADSIEPKYGKGTLEQFAGLIGTDYNTLKGYRTVWRKWKDSPVKPRTYSLAKALASYKDKDWYIENWPEETEKQARADVRRWKNEAKIEAEKKGYDLPKVMALLNDLANKRTRWEHDLDLLATHKETLTGQEIRALARVLDNVATMLITCKNKLEETETITVEEAEE
jgi:hypothetical protein